MDLSISKLKSVWDIDWVIEEGGAATAPIEDGVWVRCHFFTGSWLVRISSFATVEIFERWEKSGDWQSVISFDAEDPYSAVSEFRVEIEPHRPKA